MIFTLARRHLAVFFRDRTAVFFALLSPLIMLVLYAFFLANVQVEELGEAFPHASADDINQFVSAWVFAGITMITTLTTGLAALTVFVEDRASGRFKDFAVSPITRRQLIVSYLLATFVVAAIMSIVVLALSQVYIGLTGGALLAGNLLPALGVVLLLCAGFAALSSFVVTFIRSTGAFTSLSVIVGTGVGFLAGIYIQPGTLSAGVVNVINALPFSQAAALLREPFTEKAVTTLGQHGEGVARLQEHYGIGSLAIGDSTLTLGNIVCIFVVLIVVFTLLGAWRLRQKVR